MLRAGMGGGEEWPRGMKRASGWGEGGEPRGMECFHRRGEEVKERGFGARNVPRGKDGVRGASRCLEARIGKEGPRGASRRGAGRGCLEAG